MPFTLSHAAAVLPIIHKKRLFWNTPALVLGSMAPDFEYFIRLRPAQIYGHQGWSVLWFNVPLVLLGVFLWEKVLKEPTLQHIPASLSRYIQSRQCPRPHLPVALKIGIMFYSAILGIGSHLFWDSFTHFNADLLSLQSFFYLGFWRLPIYKILQYGSSVFGLLILSWYLYLKSRRFAENQRKSKKTMGSVYWRIVLCFGFLFSFGAFGLIQDFSAGRFIVIPISGLFLGWIFASVYHLIDCKRVGKNA